MTQAARQNRHLAILMASARTAAVLGGLSVVPARAGETPRDWVGVRPMGMGDVSTTVSNDETAAFGNPAGLSRSRNPRSRSVLHHLIFPGTVLGGNGRALGGLKSGILTPGSLLDPVIEDASLNPGKVSVSEAMIYPAAILGGKDGPTFLVGFPARNQTRVIFNDPRNPDFADVSSTTTAGGVIGVSGMSRGGSLAYGLAVRPNVRYSYVNPALDTSEFSTMGFKDTVLSESRRTTAVGVDLGVLVTAGDFWLPTLGVAVRNVPTGCVDDYENPVTGKVQRTCGTVRSGDSSPEDGTTQLDPTELRVGFSITPRARASGSKINMRLAVDMHPIPLRIGGASYGLADLNVKRLVHAGAEFYFGNALINRGFALRAGSNDSALTFGASINLAGITLDYASYAVSTGDPGEATSDRRHLLGVTTDW